MLDIGWSELLLVIVVAILVIGPQDIPKAMLALGRLVRRFQYVKFALSQQFEDLMKDADLAELRRLNEEAAAEHQHHDIDEAAADADEHEQESGQVQPQEGEGDADDDIDHTATRH